MRKPNIIIGGGMRCGTTSLHRYLTQHPKIIEASNNLKEVRFYSRIAPKGMWDEGFEWYLGKYPRIKESEMGIDSTPDYYTNPYTPARIKKYVVNPKVILLFREPVERTWSHWKHRFNAQHETELPFLEALFEESGRIKNDLEKMKTTDVKSFPVAAQTYLFKSRYSDHIKPWIDTFSEDELILIKSEDLFENEKAVVKRILDFIGLDMIKDIVIKDHNADRIAGEIDPAHEKLLQDYFRPYNKVFNELTGETYDWGY